ncbi:MAG: 2-phosphoglycolate phosphatase [Lentisphaeria bacterium]|jgi:2-phosphoglycolate phosphatase
MTLKAVFFDLDGTLLDTAPDLANALNHLLLSRGKLPLTYASIRSVVSDGAYAMLELGFGVDKDHPDTPTLRQELLDFYLEDLSTHSIPFPGISAVIDKLHEHGLAWGIVTNKPWTYTKPLMERFDFASAPICTICPDHVSERKPHPEALILACQTAGCNNDEALYVGDHLRDIQCGQRANMTTIAVGYGYISPGDSHKLWKADHAIESGSDLWPVIFSYL